MEQKFVLWINEVDKEDIGLVGGKGANLGEMTKIGLPVPASFIVTAQAYFYFLQKNDLKTKIDHYLKSLDTNNPEQLEQVSQNIRKLILSSPVPMEIISLIVKDYHRLGNFLKPALVAIRSSATAEDLPTASFAGQQETFLNIKGEAAVVEKIRRCWASLWLSRAIFYRKEQKFDHFKVGIAVPVQKMIQSETSGVMFTIDPVNYNKKVILVDAIYGLGELIVQGEVTPDHYLVDKDSLKIISKEVSQQEKMMLKKGLETKNVKVSKSYGLKQKITDEQIVKLAALGKKLEKHYFFPQDVEWAIEKGKIFIVQTRPVTTIKRMGDQKSEGANVVHLKGVNLKPILTGIGASPGIVTGPVKNLKSAKEIGKINKGDILVTEMTNPDFVPAMRKTAAIITEQGGRTAHAAIVSRELGIPCVVGAKNAMKIFKTGDMVTVNGETGEVFKGGLVIARSETTKQSPPAAMQQFRAGQDCFASLAMTKQVPKQVQNDVVKNLKTATKIYVNLAEPEKAEETAKLPVDGVGLLRAEFMMAQIGIHPKKIIKDKKQSVFINRLALDLSLFAKNFNPRPIFYRTSDFKTNEYRNLIGGKEFEPEEANPMLGFRGASRYLTNSAVFEMELQAILKVRNKMNFKNINLMLPFVRTPKELWELKKIIGANGLLRSPSFKLWLMVEIPSNVILLEKFIEAGIDGVSIGSNDLTMLIMGVDRDNSEVARLFNEEDPAVLWALEKIIKTCLKHKITSSICGQAASDYPDLVQKLINWGITSVSVSPDAVERTREIIYEAERRSVSHVEN